MGDQVIPVDVSKEYIAIKGNLGGPDKVFIVGTEDNTSISINGTNVWTVDAGETYAHTLSAPAALRDERARGRAAHDRIRLRSRRCHPASYYLHWVG